MEKRKSVSMDAFMGKYAGVYYIKLLLKEPVESRALAIRERLLKRFNEVDDVIAVSYTHLDVYKRQD